MKVYCFILTFIVLAIIETQADEGQQRSVLVPSSTDCLIDAIQCLSQHTDPHKDINKKLTALENEVTTLKNKLASVGQPNGLANLDASGHLLQKFLPAGYDKMSPYDLAWQSLHMAAAAACRGSTATGGSGRSANFVLVNDASISMKTCDQICQGHSIPSVCDAVVSLYGNPGKATSNGQRVGVFFNYGCSHGVNSGGEIVAPNTGISNPPNTFMSFCCCRKS